VGAQVLLIVQMKAYGSTSIARGFVELVAQKYRSFCFYQVQKLTKAANSTMIDHLLTLCKDDQQHSEN